MITAADCLKKYGDPRTEAHMVLWHVPLDLRGGAIPDRIYCNKDLVSPLCEAFCNLHSRGLADQIKTWDGCFNIRYARGLSTSSLHSWGIAIDINAATNGLGQEAQLSEEVVKCFTDAGFDWGGYWARRDGMHFQLAVI